nr:MAG TPA: hypothetical protein [Herelleviridae sp.]
MQVTAASSFFLSSSFPLDIYNFTVFSRFRMPTNCSAFSVKTCWVLPIYNAY